jgi:hypothetical protein
MELHKMIQNEALLRGILVYGTQKCLVGRNQARYVDGPTTYIFGQKVCTEVAVREGRSP